MRQKNILYRIVGFVVALWVPLSSFAVGVGPIHIKSYLNQPLNAVIPLRNLAELNENQIKVSIAENHFFDKGGIYRAPWLSDLQLAVNQAEIQLSTFTAIQDPVVEILLNITWPNGQVIRQYTLFLDPQSVESVHATKMTSLDKPKGQIFSTHLSKPKGIEKKKNWGEYYGPVTKEDTLWKIAHELVSGTPYTLSQGVLAIYQKNLNAFKHKNMNELLTGSQLQIPTVEEMDSILPKQAMETVALHTQQSRDFIYNANETDENTPMDNFLLQKPLKILSVIAKNDNGKF